MEPPTTTTSLIDQIRQTREDAPKRLEELLEKRADIDMEIAEIRRFMGRRSLALAAQERKQNKAKRTRKPKTDVA